MITAAAICPICTSRKMYYAFSVQQSRLVECRDCGHMMLHPPPSDEELARVYHESYALLQRNEAEQRHFAELKQATAELYLDLVERCLGRRGGRLLEIGCGAGGMLAAAAEAGYEVTGVEPSADACARARKRLGNNGRVICGDISSLAETSYSGHIFDKPAAAGDHHAAIQIEERVPGAARALDAANTTPSRSWSSKDTQGGNSYTFPSASSVPGLSSAVGS